MKGIEKGDTDGDSGHADAIAQQVNEFSRFGLEEGSILRAKQRAAFDMNFLLKN